MLKVQITPHLPHIMSVITCYVEENHESFKILLFDFKMHKVMHEIVFI